MYLHLGQDTVVRGRDIIGVFDIENATISKATRDFLRQAEQSHEVVTVSYELPKSFIVCEKQKKTAVFVSQISPATLHKRAKKMEQIEK